MEYGRRGSDVITETGYGTEKNSAWGDENKHQPLPYAAPMAKYDRTKVKPEE